jgi:hypothetical protein
MSDKKSRNLLCLTAHDAAAGNYFPKLFEATQRNPPRPGTVNHVHILHDDWCDLLAGTGPCNCSPEVQFLGEAQ